ncbi:unnamed protein product [Effrenium voratum]|uniref:Uncharacterized protein n=1 Tax=Effrenium voratum TaxID=2562239 RepID=A0AA36IBV2_9DINO|nr:unnamed protein product [Effrenium voratum]
MRFDPVTTHAVQKALDPKALKGLETLRGKKDSVLHDLVTKWQEVRNPSSGHYDYDPHKEVSTMARIAMFKGLDHDAAAASSRWQFRVATKRKRVQAKLLTHGGFSYWAATRGARADKQHSELQEARRELQKARLQTARLRSELEAEAEVSEHAAQERAAFSQELRELRSSRSSRSEMASAEETANFRRQPSIQAGLETQIEELRRERQEALQQLQGAKGAEKAARQET